MKKFFNEFKEFISKGNVMDMAIGVIIATAFGKITTSLVNDVFMPLIGMLMIPKTCAYVWTVLIGYRAMKKEQTTR